MPIIGQRWAFTKANVDAAPARPGVYCLYDGYITIYIGSSETSVRDRLQKHQSGATGSCRAGASHFAFELCSNPLEREAELIAEYKRANRGALPRCNEVTPRV